MKKEALLVLAAVFLLVFGATLSATILTPYAKALGAPWPLVGVLTASMHLVRLVFGTPIGRLADRKGVVAILHLSLALFPFIAMAYWLARDVYALIGARLLHGVASAMLLPMAMAYVGLLSPAGEEGRYMGLYNTVYFVATGLGPMAATIIADHYRSYRSTFVFLLVFSLLALATMSAVTAAMAVGSASLLAAASASAAEVGRRLGMGSTMGFLSTAYSAGMVLGCLALGLAPGGGNLNGFFYLAGGATAACVGLYAIVWRNGGTGRKARQDHGTEATRSDSASSPYGDGLLCR